MENLEQHKEWINKHLGLVIDWFSRDSISFTSIAAQVAIILIVLALARILGKKTGGWLKDRLQDKILRFRGIIHTSMEEFFFLVYSVIFIWMATVVAVTIQAQDKILRVMASLTIAWAIIRITSSTIKTPFWSRLIAVVLWTIAALNIVGWLQPTIEILDKAAFSTDNFKISLLIVVKGLFAFGVLFWSVGVISRILERFFKRSYGLTPSQRVLFQKLSQIGLFTLATIIGLNIVGIDLTALTVFSGALGLGIGFGLQKVFSNLISGFILLLDKSVKPGDVITVGSTFGWVNNLGARCVSVLTRDGKEHLIPNENLITQEVENWSYSDKKVRLHIPIGVSYHSDLQLVRELLFQAIEEHPRILKTPEPVCFITGFGDSSVDHTLIIWIGDPQEGLMNVKSDIFYRVWELFHENDIEIPFPQRDVHLKYDGDLSIKGEGQSDA